MTTDVMDSMHMGNLARAIRAAVVDDQYLNIVDTGDVSRNICKCTGQGQGLVPAWDLDDQLQGVRLPIHRYHRDHQYVWHCNTANTCARGTVGVALGPASS